MTDFIDMTRRASYVERLHTVPTIGNQNIGHHSFGVAMLCRDITNHEASAALIMAALDHDLPEVETGDIPAPVKWSSPVVSAGLTALENQFLLDHAHAMDYELTDDEARVLKIADTLELALFCLDQLQLGNQRVVPVLARCIGAMIGLPHPSNAKWSATIEVLMEKVFKFYDSFTMEKANGGK